MSAGRNVARWGALFAIMVAGIAPALARADGDGVEPVAGQTRPSVSDDGRFVAYLAPSLERGLDHASPWLLDRASGERRELAVDLQGVRDGRIAQVALSGDGCSVAIVTELALDLFRDDDAGDRWDVYRTIPSGCADAFDPGEWELVSSTGDAEPSATDRVDPSDRLSVDGSGSVVVFAERSDSGWSELRVADLAVTLGDPGRVVSVPGIPQAPPTAAGAYSGQRSPAISDDGRYVAFSADTELGPSRIEENTPSTAQWTGQVVDGVAVTQVWRWDRLPNDDDAGVALAPVSVTSDGRLGTRSSGHPAINRDGHVVVFDSEASLVAPSPDGDAALPTVRQVFRATMNDLVAVEPISTVGSTLGDAASEHPDVDASGLLVTFTTRATNLVQPAPVDSVRPEGGDVLLADVSTGTLSRVSVGGAGVAEPFGATNVAMASSGRTVVYERPAATGLGTEVVTVEQRASVSAPDLDLGTIQVGFSSARWYTTIDNRGSGPFVPRSIRIDDQRFSVVGGTCSVAVPLMPGAGCTVEVVFTPDSLGEVRARLRVDEGGFGAGDLEVGLVARGGVAAVSLTPISLDAGTGQVDHDGEPLVLTVTSTADLPSSISAVVAGGNQPEDFEIRFDSCTGAVLTPGEICHLGVVFRPTGSGPRSATIGVVEAGGASTSAVVVGVGVYRPAAGIAQAVVIDAGTVDVVGLGFTKDAALWVSWSGDDRGVVAHSDTHGGFSVRLRVPPSFGGGPRTVTVSDPTSQSPVVETAAVIVSTRSGGGSSPAHRHS